MQWLKQMCLGVSLLLLTGCIGLPEGVAPVQGFEISRYVGKWYEVARLDHRFERGLDQVTAEYAVADGGGVSVTNRGFSKAKNAWSEAQGKAFFVGDKTQGHLRVSFFGPFYSSYVIFDLDKDDYQYAFVAGPNKSNLWLLSRTPAVDEAVKQRFLARAEALGFDTQQLIYPEHSMSED